MFYDGAVVFAQFCSSSGGYTNTGSKPYLKAVPDPWDAVASNPNNTWQKTVAITTIEKAYPTHRAARGAAHHLADRAR